VVLVSLFSTVDTTPIIGGSITFAGALLAVLATLRYIKNTEDDSVLGMRATIAHMEDQLDSCRRESVRMQRQLDRLIEAMRMSNLPFPDGFWDQL
jgi:hypothetical protein